MDADTEASDASRLKKAKGLEVVAVVNRSFVVRRELINILSIFDFFEEDLYFPASSVAVLKRKL